MRLQTDWILADGTQGHTAHQDWALFFFLNHLMLL